VRTTARHLSGYSMWVEEKKEEKGGCELWNGGEMVGGDWNVEELREENIKGMKIDEHGWFVWCYFYLYSILLLGFSPPKNS
jgi:hypothetical protein